jgi:hypothetical protein
MPLRGGCFVGAKNAITLWRQRQAVLWSTPMRSPAFLVDCPSRIVSA